MSHASIPDEVRKARNFPSDIVRLSVGIEDVGDLIADIDAAFAAASTPVAVRGGGVAPVIEIKPASPIGTSACP